MTLLQVRVSDGREAAEAASAGIDAVEFVVGDAAQDLAYAQDVRDAFSGILRLRLQGPDLRPELLQSAAAIAADEVAFRLGAFDTAMLDMPPRMRLVAMLSTSDGAEAVQRVGRNVGAVMLDAGEDVRLIDAAPIAAIDAFASACRARDLPFGLSGGLEAPDVARLLLLEPNVLAFDKAVRQALSREGLLDPKALNAIRALIPPESRPRAAEAKIAKVTDRIFVRDFEISLAIGAYQAEHGKHQRVRFSIVADVFRAAGAPADMRDVFSYDIMIETVRVLAERAHVTFVETLAEEVAASILTHAEVVAVTVKVEKLDVINGVVGIEILRRRDD